jgi:hypothetical protein
LDLTLLTAVAVFFHLGTSIASSLLKDKTDQAHIATLNTKVDQVLNVVQQIAPAIPTTTPKNLGQGLADLAALAQSLSQSLSTTINPPVATTGALTVVGGTSNAG